MTDARQNNIFSPWNPGIESEIPAAYRELETIYDSANVLTTLDEINQLIAETGLSAMELIRFRPERLVLHELIVRVTADIVVLEGETEEDLGINFRTITRRIFDHHIQPHLPEIVQSYDSLCQRIEALVQQELVHVIESLSPPKVVAPTFWQKITGKKAKPAAPQQTREEREFAVIDDYKTRQQQSRDELEITVFRSLHRVLGAIARTRGFIGNNAQYLAHICLLHACNSLCSRVIGRRVGELVSVAVEHEGYALIPDAKSPVLFSLKGASASGKSHLRPMLRSKMATIDIADDGYGTISPDIWRKLLLDYDSLGESYKYAGRFTSHEVSVIDARLDRYIRDKAKKSHSIPHLVVDRFRFDSFASEKIGRVLHNTYVRYIDTMYMYFIVTPPEATVERGWARGLERGRYKAVEDYLGHCVEAYEGMPKLLFKWLANKKPRFSFKFIDNSVPRGEVPILIARGSQGWMQIFEVEPLINIERYQRINIHATSAEQVAADADDLRVAKNLGFLRQCIRRIEHIEFVDRESDQSYLLIRSGKFNVVDRQLFERQLEQGSLREFILEVAPDLLNNLNENT